MITLIKAIVIGCLIGFFPTLPFIGMHWSLGILLSLVLVMVTFWRLTTKLNTKLTSIFEKYIKFMQAQKWKLAEDALDEIRPYAKHMFMLQGHIEAKHGLIFYYQGKEDTALEHFKKATAQDWQSAVLCAYLLSKKKQDEEMIKKFESSLRLNGKQALLWNAYAFCLHRIKRTEEAIKVLNRALKKLGKGQDAETTEANLKNLQNNKDMNMKPFGELWYSLKLEPIPRQFMQRASQHPGDRGFRPRRV